MRIFADALAASKGVPCAVLAIGNFDGIHAGHRHVLAQLRELADALDAPALVMTFRPHPAAVLHGRDAPPRLSSDTQQQEALRDCGVDGLLVQPFDRQLAAWSARRFVEEMILGRLGARGVVVGEGFRFGSGRSGDPKLIEDVSRDAGARLRLVVVEPLREEGDVVSSSRVRRVVASGDDALSWRLLRRPFALEGAVVAGDGIGAKLGFRTANLEPGAMVVPGGGVHVTATRWQQRWWPSVTNVGTRPTVRGTALRIETHVLGEPGDMLDGVVRVAFLERLREERRFDGLDALAAQIALDVEAARRLHEVVHPERWPDGLGSSRS